jgi:hypothetical protein
MPRSDFVNHRALARVAFGACTALALSGCFRVTLISRYDEPTDRGITALHGKVDALMAQLDVEPTPAYAAVKPSYDAIRGDLAALRLRNASRAKNEITLQQLDVLSASIQRLEEQHRSDRLNQALVAPVHATLDQGLGGILKLELAKKELID